MQKLRKFPQQSDIQATQEEKENLSLLITFKNMKGALQTERTSITVNLTDGTFTLLLKPTIKGTFNEKPKPV